MIGGPDQNRARREALALLKRCGVEKPEEIDLELIAWHAFKALVQERPLSHCNARVVRGHLRSLITVASGTSRGRRRFNIAHEMGHLALHPNMNQLALCSVKEGFWQYRARPEEAEANFFAAELLMPEPLFSPRCQAEKPGFDLIENLAGEFATSLTATALRYVEHGPWDCCAVWSQNGNIHWISTSESFRWKVREGRLGPSTYALDFTENPGEATLLQKEVAAPQWLESDRGVARVREQSRPIGAEGLLTLLWVEADPGEEWWGEEQDEPDPEHFTPDGRRKRW
jgi:hypothetical protein